MLIPNTIEEHLYLIVLFIYFLTPFLPLSRGSKISHNFVVRPVATGSFVVGNAEVSYHGSSSDSQV